jgi:hypothetical protein
MIKNQLVQQFNGLIHSPSDPGKFKQDFFFLVKCSFSLVFFLYFFNWLLTLFKVYYINTKKIFYYFNIEFETL